MRRVLFVCVQNSGRSQMAEAFFNHMAKGKATATSAGTSPAKEVNPDVVKSMEEIGISMQGHYPKQLSFDMFKDMDLVVTMGCGAEGVCPATLVQSDDWNIEDPKGKSLDDIRNIRDEIKEKVASLVKNTI
jgi:arsenate reductase